MRLQLLDGLLDCLQQFFLFRNTIDYVSEVVNEVVKSGGLVLAISTVTEKITFHAKFAIVLHVLEHLSRPHLPRLFIDPDNLVEFDRFFV